ncbi:MAG: ADP-ribosylglycohydrolase family protein [Roseibacillus sp.]
MSKDIRSSPQLETAIRIHGLLIGTAIGDSVGLPAEGLSPASIAKRGWAPDWQHHLLFAKGLWSDDTEHTLILAQALNHSGGDPIKFQRLLARGLKHWFLFLPAGVGLATARAIIKLWFGASPEKSGVLSAGNGPCMRAALLGVVFHDEPDKRQEFNRIQTRLTHTDPKAESCSRAVVELAALFSNRREAPTPDEIWSTIIFPDSNSSFRTLLEEVRANLENEGTLDNLLKAIGGIPQKGVSGYCYHTLAAILHCGMKNHWKPEQALPAIWEAGGDTDTTGAILGALCGTLHGPDSFPKKWMTPILEFPVKVYQFETLAKATAEFHPCSIRLPFHPLLLLRNVLFLGVVLAHGFSRLLLPIRKS